MVRSIGYVHVMNRNRLGFLQIGMAGGGGEGGGGGGGRGEGGSGMVGVKLLGRHPE